MEEKFALTLKVQELIKKFGYTDELIQGPWSLKLRNKIQVVCIDSSGKPDTMSDDVWVQQGMYYMVDEIHHLGLGLINFKIEHGYDFESKIQPYEDPKMVGQDRKYAHIPELLTHGNFLYANERFNLKYPNYGSLYELLMCELHGGVHHKNRLNKNKQSTKVERKDTIQLDIDSIFRSQKHPQYRGYKDRKVG